MACRRILHFTGQMGFVLLMLVHSSITAIGAVPQQINFQGTLTDTLGNPTHGDFDMGFAFYDVATEGTALWSEAQTVPVINGIYSVLIGQNPVDNPFPANLFEGQRWLGVTVGSDAEMFPRQRLSSTPFAMKAGDADTLSGKSATDFMNTGGDTMLGDMAIDGEMSVEQDLTVGGNTTLQAVTIGNAPTENPNHGTYVMSNDMAKLTVWGRTSLNGNTSITGPLNIDGVTSVSSLLDIRGPMRVFSPADFLISITAVMATIPTITSSFISASLISSDSITTSNASIDKITSPILFEKAVTIDAEAKIKTVISYLVDTDKVDATLVDADKVDATLIVATEKHFRVPNPSDPKTEIWYASLEGPEVAAYLRGTGRLTAGKATICLPEYFSDIVVPESMTVHLTPNSAESLGLATVEKRQKEIVVRELANGTGTYAFDYYIVAVRRGYEDYRVIRPITEEK